MEPAVRGRQRPRKRANYGGATTGIRRQPRLDFTLDHGRRERNFWIRRPSTKNHRQNARSPAETKVPEMVGRKSPQKTPYLGSCWKRAVCKGWMVADAVERNRSPKQEQGIF
jgi:hypothetical protein